MEIFVRWHIDDLFGLLLVFPILNSFHSNFWSVCEIFAIFSAVWMFFPVQEEYWWVIENTNLIIALVAWSYLWTRSYEILWSRGSIDFEIEQMKFHDLCKNLTFKWREWYIAMERRWSCFKGTKICAPYRYNLGLNFSFEHEFDWDKIFQEHLNMWVFSSVLLKFWIAMRRKD